MKKIILFILALILIVGVCGCANDNAEKPNEDVHVCSYSTEWQSDGSSHYHACTCGNKKDVASHTYTQWSIVQKDNDESCERSCSVCQFAQTKNVSLITSNKNVVILNNFATYIMPSVTQIDKIDITANFSNVVIIADNVTVKELNIGANCSNITIINVDFAGDSSAVNVGGVKFSGSVDTVTFENCNFSGSVNVSASQSNVVKNLTFNGCEFKNIANDGSKGTLTAIYMSSVENFTVNNCVFDTMQYSAINIGNEGGKIGGRVTITNTVFKNTASRPLRFAGSTDGLTTNISGNTFHTLICADNQYIKCDTKYSNNDLAEITFGVNTFQTLPQASNFNGNIKIDLSAQLQMS